MAGFPAAAVAGAQTPANQALRSTQVKRLALKSQLASHSRQSSSLFIRQHDFDGNFDTRFLRVIGFDDELAFVSPSFWQLLYDRVDVEQVIVAVNDWLHLCLQEIERRGDGLHPKGS